MSSFAIDKRLLDSCHYLGRFDRCHVLLNHNALLPWFILVPQTQCSNLLQLDSNDLNTVMAESQRISSYLTSEMGYTKTNVASLGHFVSQLHIHIVGRSPNDPCWPQPIWGFLNDSAEYSPDTVGAITHQLADSFGMHRAAV